MRRQQGMTFLGMIFIALFVVIVAIFTMKIIPLYIDNYNVKRAVNALNHVSSEHFSQDMQINTKKVRTTLMNQLYINGVSDVKAKDIVIEPISYKQFKVVINYQAKANLFANVSMVIDFKIDKEVDINAP